MCVFSRNRRVLAGLCGSERDLGGKKKNTFFSLNLDLNVSRCWNHSRGKKKFLIVKRRRRFSFILLFSLLRFQNFRLEFTWKITDQDRVENGKLLCETSWASAAINSFVVIYDFFFAFPTIIFTLRNFTNLQIYLFIFLLHREPFNNDKSFFVRDLRPTNLKSDWSVRKTY